MRIVQACSLLSPRDLHTVQGFQLAMFLFIFLVTILWQISSGYRGPPLQAEFRFFMAGKWPQWILGSEMRQGERV